MTATGSVPSLADMCTSGEFDFRGSVLRYARTGTGPPVVLLHNGGTAKEVWTAQVASLRDRFEVICLDLLGFGESDLPETGFAITDYVAMLDAFLDHLGFERVSVVGNCMGSAMTLLLASAKPDRFTALVLINPLTNRTARAGIIGWVKWLPVVFPGLSRGVSRRIRAPRWVARAIVVLQFSPRHWLRGLRRPPPGTDIAGESWSNLRGRLVTMVELFADPNDLAAVDQLTPDADFPPLAVIWGASNLGLSPRAGRDLNQRLRPDLAVSLPGCGHLPMLEAPDEVSTIIGDFLSNPPIRLGAAEDSQSRSA